MGYGEDCSEIIITNLYSLFLNESEIQDVNTFQKLGQQQADIVFIFKASVMKIVQKLWGGEMCVT